MKRKIVIVGGVAGGATAAARLRRLDEIAQIILVERGEHISFANCGLPYYIGGVISNRESLILQTVEGMSQRFKLDIRNLSEVTEINRKEKKITIKNLITNENYEETYDVLILSPGAKPIKPNISGIEQAKQLFTVRNIPDIDLIKSHIETKAVKKATVIGGGFIGVEMAENLCEIGVDVSLVQKGNQLMTNSIDFEMAAILHDHMRAKGIKLYLDNEVTTFKENGSKVFLRTGQTLDTDLIILAIGVTPENTLAKNAELELGIRDTIVVNKYFQTSDPDIFAIGDVIQVKDYINGQPTMIPLASPANRQGRLVADYIAGKKTAYHGTLGTSIAKVFDLTVASTGNNENVLKRLNIDYEVVHIQPGTHAGYYPNSTPITLKLIFDKKGNILGAQGIGNQGVDKRIDVIATAIKGKLTVFDLPDLELSYAPPYSSAKDPVNLLGYVASNVLDGDVETIQWHEIEQIADNNGIFIDVREADELISGTISNSINIPLNQLRERLNELPKEETLHVFCQVGQRGYLASQILKSNGFKVKNLNGGYKLYKQTKSIEQEKFKMVTNQQHKRANEKQLDTRGLQCPGPILKVKETLDTLEEGGILSVKSSDFGFGCDIEAWCQATGHTFISSITSDNYVEAKLQKGISQSIMSSSQQPSKEGATLVVFSEDLDRALASFVIATGAASMGKKVTMFFTFWGLNILKKGTKVKKSGLEKMFDIMMPSSPSKLPISKMNYGGIGSKMIQHVMKTKNVDSLQDMIEQAQRLGIKMVACTMSMDVMGIKKEELLDNIDYAGVATYLGDARQSDLNLFI